MAKTTRTLTKAPQSRKMHKVYRNGKLVRVYYTDSGVDTGGGTKTIKTGAKHFKGNTWAPTQTMINEFRSYGREFVQQKYKLSTSRLNYLSKAINTAIQGKTSPLAKDGYIAAAGRFGDGGPMDNANENAAFKRKLMLNLENDSDLAQGSHHAWAQPTSISSLITSQLRQSQNAPADYFEAWAQSKGGTTNLLARDSSSFGMDVSYTPSALDEPLPTAGPQQQVAEGSMGAFGTTMVMDPFYAEQEDEGDDHSVPHQAGKTPILDSHGHVIGYEEDMAPGAGSDGLINPWGDGQGGGTNAYGPSAQTMAQSTMEAMALANAYFAPQRMELAYQLGDMETDMRRLAVNLGRQVDDPVLQAKLYKEGMRAVRTMDVQQNTMAFQMAEQRRREELQNFQFYDSLAQQEYQLRLANQQFYDRLELDNAYFGLQKDQLNMAMDGANPPQANTAPVPGTDPGEAAPAPTQTQPAVQQQTLPYSPSFVQPTITGGNLLGGYRR